MKSDNEMPKQWIRNIKKIDDKNHLAHGVIYAQDGSIRSFRVAENEVEARVEGAPGDFYNVRIQFKEFTEDEKGYLTDYIKGNPIIYSKLLNNQISLDFLNADVKILPSSTDDFELSCDCGRGLFCKHQAAVFHKLANIIEDDPSFMFSLRGLNLNQIINGSHGKIKSISDVLSNDSKPRLTDSENINHLVKLNYSLSDYPSFYPSSSVNFNEVLCDTLASMSRCIYQIFDSNISNEFQEFITLGNTLGGSSYYTSKTQDEIRFAFEEKWCNPQRWNEMKIVLDGNYEIANIKTGQHDNNFFMSNLKYPLFAFLAEINQIDISSYCDEVRFLHELYIFTAQLINSNAMVPELFKLENNEHHIRWIPAFDKQIYDELEYFHKRCPRNLLTFSDTKLSWENQVIALISLIFEGFSEYYISKAIPRNLASYRHEKYFRLFFINSQDFNSHSYRGKEEEIDNWLSPLFLSQKDYMLIISTYQDNLEFNLRLKVRCNNQTYEFKDIIGLDRPDIIKSISIIQNLFTKSGVSYQILNDKTMTLSQYSYFMENVAPVLRECGVEVHAPEEFSMADEARLVLKVNQKTPTSSLTLNDLVDFDWKIAIGDETYSIDDFESLTYNYRGLVVIKDRYMILDEDNLYQLKEDIANIPENPNKSDLIRYLLSNESANVEMDEKLEELMNNILEVPEVAPPESLNGTLRKYQERGFSWMLQNMQLGFGSILADDMGLGKTIQVLSVILYLKENHKLDDSKVLVVVPTSILTNWEMEIAKFAPTLKVKTYHGMNRHYPEGGFDILLTTYGMIRQDLVEFRQTPWFVIVVDEAQNIKNPNIKKTKAIKSIKAKHHIALSGTPIENNLGEYWSIFDFTNKGYLNTLQHFRNRFLNPIEKEHDDFALYDFKKITSPFILRRLKTDKNIVDELPDKIINDVYCNLSVKQAGMYDETLKQMMGDVEKSEGIRRKGLVLKLINSLKQICNHPSQFLKTDDAKTSESGKMEVLINLIENILASDEKVLIFTQYVRMGEIIKELLEEEFSQEVMFLYGKVSRKKRDRMIDEFQNGNAKIFILSLKAGGIGLNLTAASNVIHYDLWWNPAVENQATDRAYRIGQTENVMVYRFLTRGTLEERINQILIEKRELVDLAIDSDESFITEMTNEELRNMLNLRKRDNFD